MRRAATVSPPPPRSGASAAPAVGTTSAGAALDVRVTPAFGTKAYGQVRLSVVTRNGDTVPFDPNATFDYSAPFQYRWTDNTLHSKMVSVTPGQTTPIAVGNATVQVSLPAKGVCHGLTDRRSLRQQRFDPALVG